MGLILEPCQFIKLLRKILIHSLFISINFSVCKGCWMNFPTVVQYWPSAPVSACFLFSVLWWIISHLACKFGPFIDWSIYWDFWLIYSVFVNYSPHRVSELWWSIMKTCPSMLVFFCLCKFSAYPDLEYKRLTERKCLLETLKECTRVYKSIFIYMFLFG